MAYPIEMNVHQAETSGKHDGLPLVAISIAIVVLMLGGVMYLSFTALADSAFLARVSPLADEVMARMEAGGQQDLLRLCSNASHVVERFQSFATCEATRYDEDTGTGPSRQTSIELRFYETKEDAQRGHVPLGRVILEYNASGLWRKTINRWR